MVSGKSKMIFCNYWTKQKKKPQKLFFFEQKCYLTQNKNYLYCNLTFILNETIEFFKTKFASNRKVKILYFKNISFQCFDFIFYLVNLYSLLKLIQNMPLLLKLYFVSFENFCLSLRRVHLAQAFKSRSILKFT